jgi:hypothetical protein
MLIIRRQCVPSQIEELILKSGLSPHYARSSKDGPLDHPTVVEGDAGATAGPGTASSPTSASAPTKIGDRALHR